MVNLKNNESKGFLRKKGFYLILVVLLILSIGSYIFINTLTNNVISSTSYDISLNVGDYVGLNTDTDKIYFGTVPKGGSSYRELYINSADEGFLYLTVEGNIQDLIFLQNAPAKIGRNETVFNFIIVKVPKDYKEGSYEAKLNVFVLKKDNSLFNKLMPGKKIKVSEAEIIKSEPNVAINIVSNRQNELI